jgi:hypothetical protein
MHTLSFQGECRTLTAVLPLLLLQAKKAYEKEKAAYEAKKK